MPQSNPVQLHHNQQQYPGNKPMPQPPQTMNPMPQTSQTVNPMQNMPPNPNLPNPNQAQPPVRKPNINPAQIPAPPHAHFLHQQQWDTDGPSNQPLIYMTSSLLNATSQLSGPSQSMQTLQHSPAVPPPASIQYQAHDDLLPSPRILRSSVYSCPATSEVLNQCSSLDSAFSFAAKQKLGFPLGFVVTPMAELRAEEPEIPCLDYRQDSAVNVAAPDTNGFVSSNAPLSSSSATTATGGFTGGPVRCENCQAYLNPFVRPLNHQFTQFQCNICGTSSGNIIPDKYYSASFQRPSLLSTGFESPLSAGQYAQQNGHASEYGSGAVPPAERVELKKGCVDYDLTGMDDRYSLVDGRTETRACRFVFLLDCTIKSYSSGSDFDRIKCCCDVIKNSLDLYPSMEELDELIDDLDVADDTQTHNDETANGTASANGNLSPDLASRSKTRNNYKNQIQITLVTYDSQVQVYNFNSKLNQPRMSKIGELDDPFLPDALDGGLLITPNCPDASTRKSRKLFESLLDKLPGMVQRGELGNNNSGTNSQQQQPGVKSCLGAAINIGKKILEPTGGRLVVMHSSLPQFGPGALQNREDPNKLSLISGSAYNLANNSGNQNQGSQIQAAMELLHPEKTNWWINLGESLVNYGIGVNMFLFPNSYLDLASVGAVASITGGTSQIYPNFLVGRDADKFEEDFHRIISRPFGYDCLVRVRCSNGLKVDSYLGNFHMKNATDIRLGVLDSVRSIGVTFKFDSSGKLDSDSTQGERASFQVAVLYTNPFGRRLLRVINMCLPTTREVGQIFKTADLDTCMNLVAKSALADISATSNSLKQIRDSITDRCVGILAGYRKNCATSGSPGQLILPESFKLMPIYCLGLLKSKPFTAVKDVPSDFRVLEMRWLRSSPVELSEPYMYPRLWDLTDIFPSAESRDDVGLAGGEPGVVGEFDLRLNRVRMPKLCRSSVENLKPNGLYLFDNSQNLVLLIGSDISTELLAKIFGVNSLEQVNIGLKQLPRLDNQVSTQIRTIVHTIQHEYRNSNFCDFQIIRRSLDKQMEQWFSTLLVEDRNGDLVDYVDYLCFVHKRVQAVLTDD